jgi:hypothetical protein
MKKIFLLFTFVFIFSCDSDNHSDVTDKNLSSETQISSVQKNAESNVSPLPIVPESINRLLLTESWEVQYDYFLNDLYQEHGSTSHFQYAAVFLLTHIIMDEDFTSQARPTELANMSQFFMENELLSANLMMKMVLFYEENPDNQTFSMSQVVATNPGHISLLKSNLEQMRSNLEYTTNFGTNILAPGFETIIDPYL